MAKEKKEKQVKKTTGIGIRTKLLFWLLFIALVPLLVIGAASYFISSQSLEKSALDSLESSKMQSMALMEYFSERENNLRQLVEVVATLQHETFASLEGVKTLNKNIIEKHFKMLAAHTILFAERKDVQGIFNAAANARQPKINKAFFMGWIKQRKIQSLIMVDSQGKVIYSNDKAIVTGSSLADKKGTPEFTAFSKGMGKKSVFTDFSSSSLRNGEVAGYFSAPVTAGGKVAGTCLYRIMNSVFDKEMATLPGLGKSAESYLVGSDRLFRSNTRQFDEQVLANPAFLVDTDSVSEALNGQTGDMVTVNYRGDYVLSSYTPIMIAGNTWALLVEENLTKSMELLRPGQEKDYLATYAENYGYPDLYLIDIDGYIFYSAKHQADYQTNILSGPYAKTLFGKTVLSTLDSQKITVSDYSRYAPAGDKPTAFMGMPFVKDGTSQLVVAIQLPINQISDIMTAQTTAAKTADTYLVGSDKLWRTESRNPQKYKVKSTLLNPKTKVNTQPVQQALSGKSGTGKTENSLGDKVYASWAPIKYRGLNWAIINEVNQKEIAQPVTRLFQLTVLIALIGAGIVFLVSFLVSGGITRQVGAIMSAMAKVEEGDYDTEAKVLSKDELGSMATTFNQMTTTTRELIKSRQEEHDQLQESIIEMLEDISELSDGDLRVRATVHEDVTGTVADSLNMMLEELNTTIGRIKKSSEQVGLTANQLSSSTEQLAARNDTQSESIKGAVNEITQMSQAIEEAAGQALRSAQTSELSRTAATEGTRAVEDTSQAMESIRGNVQNTARAIKRLGESSQEISDFARTINEISDRTSILALNASIQAAAAGEEGRGFAVVAEEIQRLAERAAGSTRQIETLIKNILGVITDAGSSMDASIQEVVQGTSLANDALAKLEDINLRSSEVAELIGAVSEATTKQAESSTRVAAIMSGVGAVSTATAEETRETSSSMRDMATVADDMLEAVSKFTLSSDSLADAGVADDIYAEELVLEEAEELIDELDLDSDNDSGEEDSTDVSLDFLSDDANFEDEELEINLEGTDKNSPA